jgi:hypothetical protein
MAASMGNVSATSLIESLFLYYIYSIVAITYSAFCIFFLWPESYHG